MDAHKLVKMANEIGSFFESDPDPKAVLDGAAGHIKRFWDPRMRRELLRWVDDHGGAGLTPSVLKSIQANRAKLTPVERRSA
jgi:formate dehydrogenase subunit delta